MTEGPRVAYVLCTVGETSAQDDPIVLVLKRWRVLAICAALGAAAAIAYAFAAREWYEARLTVVPSNSPSSTVHDAAALAFASKLPGLDPVFSDSRRIEAVLTSGSVTDAVIDKFGLQKRYGTAYRELARAGLWAHCSTSVDRKSGVVALTCEDTDPDVAMKMTAYFGEVGNQVFQRISTSSGREEARFLEQQVVSARRDVDEASRQLRDFQEKNKVIDLPEQSKAVISAMASIEGDLISKQLELSYLSTFSGRTESRVAQLEQQISVLKSKLGQFEATQRMVDAAPGTGSGSASEFFPGALKVPQLRFELEQLLRDQKIKETVYALITERYEMAKADAARDTPTFQILDSPTLPTLRVRPMRKKLAVMGFGAGFVLGMGWILGPVWWRRRFARAS